MKIEKIDKLKINELAQEAANIIKNGGLVIAPFDTVYGIIADPRNDDALLQLYKFKKRPVTQTIGLACSNLDELSKLTVLSTNEMAFIDEKVPGPYTFIAKSNKNDISDFCKSNGTIGLRIPDNELILKITDLAGGAIAQTSCNKSEMPNCHSITDIMDQFYEYELENIGLIIDGGEIEHKNPSTIINMTKNPPEVIER